MSNILVVGGSLGGLLAANVLSRAGHAVTVLERSSEPLDGRGAGIVTHSGLLQALREAGVTVDDSLGVQVHERVVLEADGTVAARSRYAQVLTSWGRLHALLSLALPAGCLRMAVEGVEQDEGGVRIRCANGAVLSADLLVASDGIRSTVRAQCAPAVQPEYAGYVAWRGVCDEAVLSRHCLNTLFGHFGFGLPRGEQIIGYPVAGRGNETMLGQRRYNFVWYRPADMQHALPRLLTDADGVHHAGGIAPNKIHWREVATMREAARQLLAPQFCEVLEKTAQPFLQPIHDLLSPRLAFGRVVLMGDAAFVARPHVGMGVTKAGDDALALRAALAQHGATTAAGLAYESQRLAPGRAVVERGRALGAYLQAQGVDQAIRGAPEARRDAWAVLTDTAVDLAQPTVPLALAA